VVSAVQAFRSVDPDIMDSGARTGGQRLAHLLEGAGAARAAAALHRLQGRGGAVVDAAVVAEFVASDRGLGYLLLEYNNNMNTRWPSPPSSCSR
jgi:NitT/TauT family transport system permease protein